MVEFKVAKIDVFIVLKIVFGLEKYEIVMLYDSMCVCFCTTYLVIEVGVFIINSKINVE